MRRELRFVTPLEALIYFRTLPLFGDLPPAELAQLCSTASEQQFRRGRPLLTEGIAADAIHVIVEGHVRQTRSGEKSRDFRSGESVGVAAMLSQDPRGIHVTAVTPVTTLRLGREGLERLFAEEFTIYHHVLRAVCRATRDERRQLGDATQPQPTVEVVGAGQELHLVDRLLALRQGLSFAARHALALGELAARSREAWFEPGQLLWSQGERAEDLVVLFAGGVSCRTEDGVSFEIGSPGSFGFADAIAERPRSYTATAAGPARGLRIHRETLIDALEHHTDLAERCLTATAAGLFDLTGRAEQSVVAVQKLHARADTTVA